MQNSSHIEEITQQKTKIIKIHQTQILKDSILMLDRDNKMDKISIKYHILIIIVIVKTINKKNHFNQFLGQLKNHSLLFITIDHFK